ncbi:MAG: NAD-dependent epimerase/dehydratase family protein [Acidobacteria bacterium]|nr:MAG: NAD-dependent epimerase/dehydratase family protein [Acidobacteriota bacterium]
MYVIAGASGNTGRVAAEVLLTRGRKVTVLGRQVNRLLPLVGKGAEALEVNLQDTPRLTEALRGAKAAYLLIPPNLAAADFIDYSRKTADSLARAVSESGIRYVVFLSSMGAQLPDGTGPIKALHYAEEQLRKIENLNLLAVRAGFFMENFYMSIPAVQQYGMLAGDIAPDVRIPMISTGDIGRYVADRLDKLDFTGTEVRELLGQRDIAMREAATIIGKALGRSDLKYQQFDAHAIKQAMTAAGVSDSLADLIVEMNRAMSEGRVAATQPRTAENTTSTSLEEFSRRQLADAAVQLQSAVTKS